MKPFSWSWSRLKNYRTCPKRHYEVDIAKNYREESEALTWGNQVHDALANRIAKKTPLPVTMQHFEDWGQRVSDKKQAGYKVLVENKLAMNQSFGPTSFFDNTTWFRGVVDVLMLSTISAVSLDWKTGGKIQPEFEQLMLSAQLIFAHYPSVEQVGARYVWLGHDQETTKVYHRDQMAPLWNELWPTINAMTEAHRTTTYPPKPGGLCKRYCPVTSCPHHGKGSY